jgi:amidase
VSLPFTWAEWYTIDATDLAARIARREVSAEEVAQQTAAAVEHTGYALGAVVELFADAVADPAAAGARPGGPLYGVPLFMKDSGSGMAGRLREWGSPLASGQVCPSDCPLTANLRAAGFNLIGRSSLSEWGKAFDTTYHRNGELVIARNPWNPARTPGGSSGGSAALVAAGVVPLAKGGDAAGSIRVPASFTGLVGLKPTRGLLPPPRGTNELANHRVQEGVLTRSVRDQAAALDQMIRPTGRAAFIPAARPPADFQSLLRTDTPRVRVGVSTGSWGLPGTCDAVVADRVQAVARILAGLGHSVLHIADDAICDWKPFWSDFTTSWIATAGYWLDIAAQRQLTRAQLDARLMPQNRALLAQYEQLTVAELRKALYGNARSTAHIANLFDQIDALLTPAFFDRVPPANGPYSLTSDASLDQWMTSFRAAARYTALGNETGLPGLAVPAGRDPDGLPIGVMIYGPPLSDGLLLQLAAQIERSRPEWFGAAPLRFSPASPETHPDVRAPGPGQAPQETRTAATRPSAP